MRWFRPDDGCLATPATMGAGGVLKGEDSRIGTGFTRCWDDLQQFSQSNTMNAVGMCTQCSGKWTTRPLT
jgi:hypothetical protein